MPRFGIYQDGITQQCQALLNNRFIQNCVTKHSAGHCPSWKSGENLICLSVICGSCHIDLIQMKEMISNSLAANDIQSGIRLCHSLKLFFFVGPIQLYKSCFLENESLHRYRRVIFAMSTFFPLTVSLITLCFFFSSLIPYQISQTLLTVRSAFCSPGYSRTLQGPNLTSLIPAHRHKL